MPWYIWLIVGMFTGGLVIYVALMIYLSKSFRR